MRKLKVVVAPSGFKEALGSEEIAKAIASGIRRAGDVVVAEVPLVDGGEGFTETLVRITGGTMQRVSVTGPVGKPVDSFWGLLGDAPEPTAVIEMAAAAGLRLVPRHQRDPLVTTTYGVGELVSAALDHGVKRILLGCGDSGTNDGGAGLAQALGIRLADAAGNDIGRGGGALLDLATIDLGGRDPRLDEVDIDVACNVHNVLCGPRGVARVFGPQKGASEEVVVRLESALDHYAGVIEAATGTDVRDIGGGGASGGLGAALHALVGATLHPRYEILMDYLDLDGQIEGADLVFTAEGTLDAQTSCGKMPAEVGRRARALGIPVIALAGTIGQDAAVVHTDGIDAYFSVLVGPHTLDEAIARTAEQVALCAEHVMRTILVGRRISCRSASADPA